MVEKCLICNESFEHDFIKHLRSHKISTENYYTQYHNKKDMFTCEPIVFRNRDQYLAARFNTRQNLLSYIKGVDKATAQKLSTDMLLERKVARGLIYAPTQVELRSIIMPAIASYNNLFGDYYKYCAELGFKNKHETMIPSFNQNEFKIQVDTREKLPFQFGKVKSKKLDYGDYKLHAGKRAIYFERKSLMDFIGTLSSGMERFIKEIERSSYLIVIVETSLSTALSFNHLPYIKTRTRINPDFLFHNVRELLQKYENLQFLFVDGRKKCVEVMKNIYNMNEDYQKTDLQFLHDSCLI